MSENYKLTDNNYYVEEYLKKQIIIGHTYNNGMVHYDSWLNRNCGNYKKTAMFTIDFNGNVHNHFNPKFFSDFIGDNEIDKHAITITLSNEGWLDPKDDGYVNWIGHKYNRKSKVIDLNWRGKKYWAPYTKKQIASLIKLCREVCLEFNIKNNCIGHNTFDNKSVNYEGILFASNYNKNRTDLNPSIDFYKLKTKIEKKINYGKEK